MCVVIPRRFLSVGALTDGPKHDRGGRTGIDCRDFRGIGGAGGAAVMSGIHGDKGENEQEE